MALQEAAGPATGPPQGPATHHCRDCGVYFESSKSLEVHLQYHKENLLTKWASQAAQTPHTAGDADNNNVKRRDFPAQAQPAQTAPADSTVLPSGPGRPNSTSGYPPAGSPFQGHPQTPSSYTSAPSPYDNDVPSNPGPSPSSTSFGYSNGNGEYPQHAYNGYNRSPRATQPGYYTEEGFISNAPSDYVMRSTTPSSPSSSSAFRFQPYKNYNLDKNGVSSSSPFQCDKCGFVCESHGQLADHIKSAHPLFTSNGSAFQPPEGYHDTPDILDLDCQQKFRPEEENTLPPVNNPHSVSAMLNPWPNNKPQSFPPYVTSSNHAYQNGAFHDSFPPNPPTNVPTSNPVAAPTSPKAERSGANKGDAWKSNEARRPKTYNCSACNKWFTSSGHLKRHYNTTLHKNAVKQSGQPDPATLPISSHHHPNRDPAYIHSSKTPAGVPNPPPNLSAPPKKKAKSMSPQGDGSGSSPALSTTADDSSKSGFGSSFDVQSPSTAQPPYDNGYPPPPSAAEPYDYYRYETHRLPLQPNHSSSSSSSTSSNGTPSGPPPPPLSSQPPNYQAGPSVSPSGGLPPFCHRPLHISLHTQSQPTTTTTTTFMGETTTTLVNEHQQQQQPPQPQHHHHRDLQPQDTTRPYTNSLTTTGNEQQQQQTAVLPSFSQLLPSYYESQSDYGFVIKSEMEEFGGFGYQTIKPELEDFDGMLSDDQSQSPNSPVQVPTSTIEVIPKPKRTPRRRKKNEVSSNLVSSTGSPTRKSDIKCEECDKYFNRICYLTQHNKCFHSGAKPFKCDRCGKRFHSEGGAKEHERRHAGVKPYRCEVCPKSFNHKTDLRRHLYLHSGSKPFACDACGKGFIRKDHMLKHTETHKGTRRRFLGDVVEDYLDGMEKKPAGIDEDN